MRSVCYVCVNINLIYEFGFNLHDSWRNDKKDQEGEEKEEEDLRPTVYF